MRVWSRSADAVPAVAHLTAAGGVRPRRHISSCSAGQSPSLARRSLNSAPAGPHDARPHHSRLDVTAPPHANTLAQTHTHTPSTFRHPPPAALLLVAPFCLVSCARRTRGSTARQKCPQPTSDTGVCLPPCACMCVPVHSLAGPPGLLPA
ncbi:unnamed protein product [Protopolystoma xenopodis]|uniref:Uncharacterized protein n=1 Tax=Protopolystoma xenopodis TaxID=117903 RepID=A0A3S5AP22_9PLAT|nr:unnamed protein product [Protopolystoma xenopodis]